MHRPWQYNHCQNSIRMQNKARDMESQNHGQINIQKVNTVSQTCRNCGDKYPHEQDNNVQHKAKHGANAENLTILRKSVKAEQRSKIVHKTSNVHNIRKQSRKGKTQPIQVRKSVSENRPTTSTCIPILVQSNF